MTTTFRPTYTIFEDPLIDTDDYQQTIKWKSHDVVFHIEGLKFIKIRVMIPHNITITNMLRRATRHWNNIKNNETFRTIYRKGEIFQKRLQRDLLKNIPKDIKLEHPMESF